MNIIAISGFSGSGKDTAADMLMSKGVFVRMALADRIKRICKEVFLFTEEQLWGASDNRNVPDPRYMTPEGNPLAPRETLKTLGTEWAREHYPDVWVERLLDDIRLVRAGFSYHRSVGVSGVPAAPTASVDGVIITDCRFRNEMEALKKAGATLIRVKRKGIESPPSNHPSEVEQAEMPDIYFDYILRNNLSLDYLSGQVDALWHHLRGSL